MNERYVCHHAYAGPRADALISGETFTLWFMTYGIIHQQDSPDVSRLKQIITQRTSGDEALSVDTKIIAKTRHWLDSYPRAQRAYEQAIEKFENGEYQRNTLDDMRFSLEMLVKDLLKNERSLENNKNDLATALKYRKVSAEFRNMVTTLVSYFCTYQNDHVKHNDNIKENELEYTIEFTSTVMKFLIKTLG